MSPEAIIAVVLAAALVVFAVALIQVLRLGRGIDRLIPTIERAEALGLEQSRRVAALESLQDAQRTAEDALETGASIVREVHRGIASIPFGILEAIPGASQPTRVVRGIHDAITDSVYGALSGLNKGVGRELRRGMKLGHPEVPKPSSSATEASRDEGGEEPPLPR